MNIEQLYDTSFNRLLDIMQALRSKCPWDQKQTIHTLRQLTIEEVYELVDSITKEDWSGIEEELGDLLLHIVFYATIAHEEKQFTIEDVIRKVCNKLVFRHPHIYTFLSVDNEEEVKRNWENLKLKEGKKSVLGGVPTGLPALIKAVRLQEKAKQVGFEWEQTEQVIAKVEEEMNELKEAYTLMTQSEIEEEFGDLMFSMVNLARFLRIDPEHALELTNKKFKRRFEKMEDILVTPTKSLSDYTLQEMDKTWNVIKNAEKK
ncbi:MAG: nucleoside triphosphate pyrophosphohydrolase [Chitinophagaceae bacterium]